MAERDAAAVRVDALAREAPEAAVDPGLLAQEVLVLERLDVAQHLRREGLVDLPQVDVARSARPLRASRRGMP